MGKFIDLTGQIYNELTVLEKIEGRSCHGSILWKCRCSCGNIIEVSSHSLRCGHTKSCGHLQLEKVTKHNMSHSKEYHIWQKIKNRCYNQHDKNYSDYGGRGIKVCESWLEDFQNFYNDMGPIPSKNHSIERIDVNGNYEPENCKWITLQEQARNRRNTKLTKGDVIKIRDEHTSNFKSYLSLAEFSRILGEQYSVHPDTINHIVRKIIWKDV